MYSRTAVEGNVRGWTVDRWPYAKGVSEDSVLQHSEDGLHTNSCANSYDTTFGAISSAIALSVLDADDRRLAMVDPAELHRLGLVAVVVLPVRIDLIDLGCSREHPALDSYTGAEPVSYEPRGVFRNAQLVGELEARHSLAPDHQERTDQPLVQRDRAALDHVAVQRLKYFLHSPQSGAASAWRSALCAHRPKNRNEGRDRLQFGQLSTSSHGVAARSFANRSKSSTRRRPSMTLEYGHRQVNCVGPAGIHPKCAPTVGSGCLASFLSTQSQSSVRCPSVPSQGESSLR